MRVRTFLLDLFVNVFHDMNMIHEPGAATLAVRDPSSLSPVERRRAEKVERILDATLAVVLEHGVEGVTISRLAKKLSWSVGALYRYFPGKEAVLAELQIRVLSDIGARIVADLEASLRAPVIAGLPDGDRALLGLMVAADTYRRLALEAPARFALISGVIAAPREILQGKEAEAVAFALQALLGQIAELVSDAQRAGALREGNAATRTLLLWSSVQGTLQIRKLARLDERMADLPALVVELVESLLAGWGAAPSSLVFLRPFVQVAG